MYGSRPPPPNRSRIILGDGFTNKVELVGKVDLIFHSKTEISATLYGVSSMPGLGFNLFLFRVTQENHEITLNKNGAHLMDERLTFARKVNGSYTCATRVLSEHIVGRSTTLAVFGASRPPPSSVLDSPLPLTAVPPH